MGKDAMQQKLLRRSDGQRTYAVVLEIGDEVMQCLGRFVTAENVSAAQLTAVGALGDDVFRMGEKRLPVYSRDGAGRSRFAHRRCCGGKSSLHVHLVVGTRADQSRYIQGTAEDRRNQRSGKIRQQYDDPHARELGEVHEIEFRHHGQDGGAT
jgi:hypothetical protein